MQKVRLVPNAKDTDGKPLKLDFFNNDLFISEIKNKTYVISCGAWQCEVYFDQVQFIKE